MNVGLAATDNNAFATYNAVFANCIADAAILEGQILIWSTTVDANVGLLGHSVEQTTTADSGLVAGVAHTDAALGTPFLVQTYGVADIIVTTGNVAAAGAGIATDTVSGSAGDAANSTSTTTGEDVVAVAGISLEARGTDGRARCLLRCM
jgi:hypothetical protein